MSYYNDYAETYGSNSAYGKGLTAAAKAQLINKLRGGNYSGNMNRNDLGFKAYYNSLMGKAAPKGIGAPAGSNGLGAPTARGGVTSNAAKRRQLDNDRMLNQAYDSALKHGLYTQVEATEDDVNAELARNPIASHERLKRVRDNISGRVKWVVDNTASGPEKGIGGNWRRNQAAWQTGIGAVTGAITGGIPGAVLGAASGYASGSKAEKDIRAQPDPKTGPRPVKRYMLRDVARQRAAGAGNFNYTEQAEM